MIQLTYFAEFRYKMVLLVLLGDEKLSNAGEESQNFEQRGWEIIAVFS